MICVSDFPTVGCSCILVVRCGAPQYSRRPAVIPMRTAYVVPLASVALGGAVKVSVFAVKVDGSVSKCSSVLGAPSLSASQIEALKLTVPPE